jgi:hypothetical protein
MPEIPNCSFLPKLLPALFLKNPWPFEILAEALNWVAMLAVFHVITLLFYQQS